MHANILIANLDLLARELQYHFLKPRQLNKTRMVIDEFDGTSVEEEDVMDDFETHDNLANSKSDQNINSGIHEYTVYHTCRCMLLCTLKKKYIRFSSKFSNTERSFYRVVEWNFS